MRGLLPLLMLPACTFAPGGGFADVRTTSVRLALEGSTLEALGGEQVAVSTAVLSFETVEVLALVGADSVDFDPADPPEGYTLCHGEHCHSTSGALVSYDEIVAELSGGAAGFEAVAAIGAGVEASLLSGAEVSLPDTASLPLGSVSRVALTAPRLLLEGETADGLVVLIDVAASADLSGELLHDVDRDGPADLQLDVDGLVPDTLLAAVSLESLAQDGVVLIDDTQTGITQTVDEALRTTVVHGALQPVD